MKLLVQRVLEANVSVNKEIVGQIKQGLLVFLGVEKGDTTAQADYLANKLVNLRIFEDENGKMNLSPDKIGADLLIISQFTLFADCRSRRPGFSLAARPETAIPLYEQVIRECRERGFHVETGVFAAEMKVDSENDGPVTILLDTNEL